jgi:hypothetical protein
MNDEKSDDDVDAKMYAAYSCLDYGQEFDSRKELEYIQKLETKI